MDNTVPTTQQVCSIEGCGNKPLARTWCSKHYYRWKRTGDPLATSRTPPIAADATEKLCPRCLVVKPLEEFGTRRGGKPKGYCEACESAYQADHASTPDGREMRRKARATWNDNNHEYFLMYRYGIKKADYDRMLAEQDGRCAICRSDVPGGKYTLWPVDHCHTTNQVRGLLCHRCNMGLGYFKDDVNRLRSAIAYLTKNA